VSVKLNITIAYTLASTGNKNLIQIRRYYRVIFNVVNIWQVKTIYASVHYDKCCVLAWQRILIYSKESMFSAIKTHKKKKCFLVKFSTLFQTNSFLHFCNVHVIVLRTESVWMVCTLARVRARILHAHDRPAGRPARSVKTSQRGDSRVAVCQYGA